MSRPRGYARWDPKPDTLRLVGQVGEVLDEYREHLPLTVRQVFYRLVGAFGYAKTEQAYSRLCEHVVRARRAGMIPFSSIRDDGTASLGGDYGYAGPEEFWQAVKRSADGYSRLRSEGQPQRIELWCEAKGMAPQLARVGRDYGVPVYSTGGFASLTVNYEIAERALAAEVPTVFLHVGDFDPSGESIFDAMTEDAEKFVMQGLVSREGRKEMTVGEIRALDGPQLRPERVALTAEQVEEHALETAPPKRSDTRSRNWIGETCQAEAMPPDLLAEIVRDAIERHVDLDRMEEVERKADEERIELRRRLADAIGDE